MAEQSYLTQDTPTPLTLAVSPTSVTSKSLDIIPLLLDLHKTITSLTDISYPQISYSTYIQLQTVYARLTHMLL